MYNLFITCEHASNHVPDILAASLGKRKILLYSHRGFDPGALEAAQRIASTAGAPLVAGTCTRLAIDLNRSEHNLNRFTKWSRVCGREGMNDLESRWYRPFRKKILQYVDDLAEEEYHLVHLSVHSFTPVYKGVRRNADIGLLYDPSRKGERGFAIVLKEQVREMMPKLSVRYNYPYRGVSDGTCR